MTEKRFNVRKSGNGLFYRDGNYEIDNTIQFIVETVEMKLNQLYEENEQLKQALKESYINEICENCRYGNYFLTNNYDGGFEGDFECTKKHFGNEHWKCDGLTECDDFELNLKGDVE